MLDVEQVAAAADAGAAFTVAPGLDLAVADAAAARGLPHLPGVATPTEAQQALRHGLTWLKAFPAISLGPAWFKAVAGPLPQLRFVATGGLDAGNAGAFLQAGVRVVAVGSALSDPTQLDALAKLTRPPHPASPPAHPRRSCTSCPHERRRVRFATWSTTESARSAGQGTGGGGRGRVAGWRGCAMA